MLTSSELAVLRADVLTTLADTCVIQTVTRATDEAGNVGETYANGATVACRLDPVSRRRTGDEHVAAAERAIMFYVLTLPYDVSIALGGRVVHGGKTYEIVELDDTHSLRIVKRATVAYIQGA